MSEKIVQLNEEVIKGKRNEFVRRSVEETLNKLLEAVTQAARYEHSVMLVIMLQSYQATMVQGYRISCFLETGR